MQTGTASQHLIAHNLITLHAEKRMQQRGIPANLVKAVLCYGRTIHARGITFRVIGRKEVARYARLGIDLAEAEGIHVLVESDGSVVTLYRNHDLRLIRPTKRRHSVYH